MLQAFRIYSLLRIIIKKGTMDFRPVIGQMTSSEICSGQSGTKASFSPSSLVFSY